jgi:hypothetical protein
VVVVQRALHAEEEAAHAAAQVVSQQGHVQALQVSSTGWHLMHQRWLGFVPVMLAGKYASCMPVAHSHELARNAKMYTSPCQW